MECGYPSCSMNLNSEEYRHHFNTYHRGSQSIMRCPTCHEEYVNRKQFYKHLHTKHGFNTDPGADSVPIQHGMFCLWANFYCLLNVNIFF
jgi:hypothetical protein